MLLSNCISKLHLSEFVVVTRQATTHLVDDEDDQQSTGGNVEDDALDFHMLTTIIERLDYCQKRQCAITFPYRREKLYEFSQNFSIVVK